LARKIRNRPEIGIVAAEHSPAQFGVHVTVVEALIDDVA
jgi:hypothetical protein